jgi:HSP20 family molecular chaperone IbpA
MWPRVTDWLDTLALGDLSWRAGLPHTVRIEEYTKEGKFTIRAEIPGIDPETDIEINVEDGVLTLEGQRQEKHQSGQRSEFYYGRFMRSVTLPNGADEDHIKATYRDGILEVMVPVTKKSEHNHRIQVIRTE